MKRTILLRLYPARWRVRYGDELADLVRAEPLTVRAVLDLVRGAAFAHLHPGLAAPGLAASGGVGFVLIRSSLPFPGLVMGLVLFAGLLFALGARPVFAYSPVSCPAGYVKAPPIWGIGSGPYDCVGPRSAGSVERLAGGMERREVGLYLSKIPFRIFDFDFVQGTAHFLGPAVPPGP